MVGETVRRVMASIMRSSVGQLFNMHGAQLHGKEGFSNKKLFDVVCSKSGCPKPDRVAD